MLYQLPDGRTVEISIHDYLDFTDAELKGLIGYTHIGDLIGNPLYGSAITKPEQPISEDPADFNDVDLKDIPIKHKLDDQDYTPETE